MRKTIFGMIIFICTSSFIQAQQSDMRLIDKSMSQGVNESIEIDIKDISLDIATSQWLKFIKKYKGKTKLDKSKMEYFTDNATLPGISENSVDVYATIVEFQSDGQIRASVWIDLGGSFLNQKDNPERIETAKNLLTVYVKNTLVAMAEEELQAEEKILKSLNNEMNSLEKDKAKFESKIADAEKLIAEMKANIANNIDEQKQKAEEISTQQTNVDNAQSKLARSKS